MIVKEVKNLLNEKYSPSFLDVVDNTDKHIHHSNYTGGRHLSIKIQSSKLLTDDLLAAHRSIYNTLGEYISLIHAIQIKIL
ncbi:MAG: BolA/IbaG family iron-sulfur metabolism protein [Pseudomonadota bacterium]